MRRLSALARFAVNLPKSRTSHPTGCRACSRISEQRTITINRKNHFMTGKPSPADQAGPPEANEEECTPFANLLAAATTRTDPCPESGAWVDEKWTSLVSECTKQHLRETGQEGVLHPPNPRVKVIGVDAGGMPGLWREATIAEIAAIEPPSFRALAIMENKIFGHEDQEAADLILSVDVEEAGVLGILVQARLQPPMPPVKSNRWFGWFRRRRDAPDDGNLFAAFGIPLNAKGGGDE